MPCADVVSAAREDGAVDAKAIVDGTGHEVSANTIMLDRGMALRCTTWTKVEALSLW